MRVYVCMSAVFHNTTLDYRRKNTVYVTIKITLVISINISSYYISLALWDTEYGLRFLTKMKWRPKLSNNSVLCCPTQHTSIICNLCQTLHQYDVRHFLISSLCWTDRSMNVWYESVSRPN